MSQSRVLYVFSNLSSVPFPRETLIKWLQISVIQCIYNLSMCFRASLQLAH